MFVAIGSHTDYKPIFKHFLRHDKKSGSTVMHSSPTSVVPHRNVSSNWNTYKCLKVTVMLFLRKFQP